MIFGVARKPYSAPARFQVNGPVSTIKYYFAKEGAAFYTEPNIFFPLRWDLDWKPRSGVGEICTAPRENMWDNLQPFGDGSESHGSVNDFLGLTEYQGPIDISQVPACRVPLILEFDVVRNGVKADCGVELNVVRTLHQYRVPLALSATTNRRAYYVPLELNTVTRRSIGGPLALALETKRTSPVSFLCGVSLDCRMTGFTFTRSPYGTPALVEVSALTTVRDYGSYGTPALVEVSAAGGGVGSGGYGTSALVEVSAAGGGVGSGGYGTPALVEVSAPSGV